MKKFTVSAGVFLVIFLFGTVACAQARETATALRPRITPSMAAETVPE